MTSLYSTRPHKVYTLEQFVAQAEALANQDHRKHEFIRFLITGEYFDQHQAVIDPIRNVLENNQHVDVARDYDSVLGIADKIVVTSSIAIYPIPKPVEALKTSIHIKYSIEKGDTTTHVPVHRIPNFQFGMWGTRHMIHIFFPLLVSPERAGVQLSKQEKQDFYEMGLHPTMDELDPFGISDWPPTYDTEAFRAQKHSGLMSYQTKMIPDWQVPNLSEKLRTVLRDNHVDWAEGFFFLHTIRGTKQSTRHAKNAEAAQQALEEFFDEANIPMESSQEGEWWVDVGLEFSSGTAACLQWRTSSHVHIVKEVLGIEEGPARRITSLGSSKYSRDLVSHLTAVSGCRIEPGTQAKGDFHATYFQMYTTDKSITYNPEGIHHGKFLPMKSAMGDIQPVKFLESLFNAYSSAIEKNASNARVEVRVPLAHATSVLLSYRLDVVRESLLSFTRGDWWGLRVYRLLAFSKVLEEQAMGSPAHRVKPDALLLTAACVWLVNGLHARPDDGPGSRSLMQAILPVTDLVSAESVTLAYPARTRAEEEEEEESDGGDEDAISVPYNPNGMVFLRRIQVGEEINVPRMRVGGPFLTAPAFKFHFGCTLEDLKNKYYTVGIISRQTTAKKRIVTNKTRSTPIYVNFSSEPEPDLFSLAEHGHRLPPPPVDGGSDVESEEEGDGYSGSIDTQVSQMWRQFLIDVAVKTPNPRGATSSSYFTVSKEERLSVGEDLYNNDMLSDMWRACQYKICSKDDWTRAFDHLFPPPGRETSKTVQNYTQCKYFIKWKEIAGTADKSSVDAIRKSIWKKLYALAWIPHACQDKMWPTSQTAPGFTRLPPESKGPAPRILVKRKPRWQADEDAPSP